MVVRGCSLLREVYLWLFRTLGDGPGALFYWLTCRFLFFPLLVFWALSSAFCWSLSLPRACWWL